jgi:hypothetical protein
VKHPPLAIASGALFLLGLSAQASAQAKPDFSGTWVLVSPVEQAGQEHTITQDATTFTRSHASEGPGHTSTYKLDGSETRLTLTSHGKEIVTLARASWDGDRLVVAEDVTYPDGRTLAKKSTWALDGQGQLILEFTERFEGKPEMTTRVVYRKKKG